MKLFLILSFSLLSISAVGQNDTTKIVYEKIYDLKDGSFHKRTLTLYSNGNFLFHSYRRIKPDRADENHYAKGTWTEKKDLYLFSTNGITDIDEKHTLNFDKSRARVFKDGSLKFLNSEISWVKGMPLDRIK